MYRVKCGAYERDFDTLGEAVSFARSEVATNVALAMPEPWLTATIWCLHDIVYPADVVTPTA